ncbi:MAG: hypothetical protein IT162_23575 [Bryobacterales bacterium]|nr:hypothetical protein [Bryobacterales bacterium]
MALIVLPWGAVYGQAAPDCGKGIEVIAQGILAASPASKSRAIIQGLADPNLLGLCLANTDDLKTAIAKVIEIKRIDKQVGASGASSGSTTLVSSGAAPRILGAAVEYGAVAQALSGSTVTFRTTPAKLLTALTKAYGPDAPLPDDATVRALGRVNFSASFDTTRTAQGDTPNGSPFLANYRQLSEATVRVELWNQRDPFVRGNLKKIGDLGGGQVYRQFANSLNRFFQASPQELNAAREEAGQKLTRAANAKEAEEALASYLTALRAIYHSRADLQAKLKDMIDSLVKADAAHKAVYRQIAKAPILTFEYAFERPPLVKAAAAAAAATESTAATAPPAPDHHTARLILAGSLLEAEYTLTAASTWFHTARPDMSGNFRSFQFGGKIDVPVGQLSPLARGTLTFSGLYMNLHQRPLGFDLKINDEKVNKPGSIGWFQARYSIPVSDNGISIPVSLTVSNRTELIKEREIRANIGLSFDLDKLIASR